MKKHEHKNTNPKEKRIDRIAVKVWMVKKRLTARDIQRDLGYRYPTQVSETINGVRNDRQVLYWFLNHGCPVKYLELPPDMVNLIRFEVQS